MTERHKGDQLDSKQERSRVTWVQIPHPSTIFMNNLIKQLEKIINNIKFELECADEVLSVLKDQEDNVDNLSTDQWGGAGPDCIIERLTAARRT